MRHLKLKDPKWAGYSGYIGPVQFKNGISIEPVQKIIANRLTSAMAMEACDEDGENAEPTGLAHRLVSEAKSRAPVVPEHRRLTEREKEAELRQMALKAQKAPTDTFYTVAQLEEIADKGGIKALRMIGDKWDVRDKSIPALKEKILVAQAEFLAKRDKVLAVKFGKADEQSVDPSVADENKPASDDTLVGSDRLASTYEIAGKTVTLGEIVQAAHEKFGGTVDEWNALDNDAREDLIRLSLDAFLAEAG